MASRAPDRATLLARIDDLRKSQPPKRNGSRVLSWDDFAEVLGVDRGTVYRWKRKTKPSNPDADSQQRLARLAGTDPDWFRIATPEEREADYVTREELGRYREALRLLLADRSPKVRAAVEALLQGGGEG